MTASLLIVGNDFATATVGIGGTASALAPGVLANDSDPDRDPLFVSTVQYGPGLATAAGSSVLGGHGSLTLNANGSYSYTVTDLTGPTGVHLHDIFTYTDSDGLGGETGSATLDITLDRAPVAANDAANVKIGGVVRGNVLTNDTDPDGDPIHVTGGTFQGTYGVLVLDANGDGGYTYTADRHAHLPRNGAVQDSFQYTESDGLGGTAQGTLTISITQMGQTGTMGSPGQTLTGGNGKDLLDGSLGTQTLIGNNGADALIGGPGDHLTGGLGPDTFTFKGNFGANEITDYRYPDLIQLDKSEFGSAANVLLHAVDDGHNTTITDPLNSANTILLDHVLVSQLSVHDFHLV